MEPKGTITFVMESNIWPWILKYEMTYQSTEPDLHMLVELATPLPVSHFKLPKNTLNAS